MFKSDLFANKTADADSLAEYGFCEADGIFVYSAPILDGQFKMTVLSDGKNITGTRVFDNASEEEYTLHLVDGAVGEFVGEVRAEYVKVLSDIAEKCFTPDIFADCARRVAEYALEKYGDRLEYLWEKLPDAAVLRRKDTGKWYAVFMKIKRSRLGLEGEDSADIIDVRCEPSKLPLKIDGASRFSGYHMNKKHWLTLLLDGSVPFEELAESLDYSYSAAK